MCVRYKYKQSQQDGPFEIYLHQPRGGCSSLQCAASLVVLTCLHTAHVTRLSARVRVQVPLREQLPVIPPHIDAVSRHVVSETQRQRFLACTFPGSVVSLLEHKLALSSQKHEDGRTLVIISSLIRLDHLPRISSRCANQNHINNSILS